MAVQVKETRVVQGRSDLHNEPPNLPSQTYYNRRRPNVVTQDQAQLLIDESIARDNIRDDDEIEAQIERDNARDNAFYASLRPHIHTQSIPLSIWTIVHNKGHLADVTTYGVDGSVIIGDVTHDNSSVATVVFSIPISGRARVD